jgi:hypothetical protein
VWTLLIGLAACGDDAQEASPAGQRFCELMRQGDAGEIGSATPDPFAPGTEEDVVAGWQLWASEPEVQSWMDALVRAAPEPIRADTSVLVDGLQQFADSGDPAVVERDAPSEASERVDRWTDENCEHRDVIDAEPIIGVGVDTDE